MRALKVMYVSALIAATAILVTSVPLRASDTDARIESSAKATYIFQTYLKGDDIKFQSNDGAVTLTGTVAMESHKSMAQDVVTDLPGVKSVDNQLVVKDAPSATNSDFWIKDKVKTTLLFHRSVSAVNTEVDVKDGVVTLSGVASSQASKRAGRRVCQGRGGGQGREQPDDRNGRPGDDGRHGAGRIGQERR